MSRKPVYATFESCGGAVIHRLPLEVFPHFWAYVYVVRKDEFCILIDSGSGLETSHRHLLDGLQMAGLQPSDLSHILLTHAHIDHYSGLSRLKPLTPARVGVHELDLQTVAHHETRLVYISRRLAAFLAETGLSQEQADELLGIYRFTKSIYQSVSVDFTYEAIDLRLGPLEMVHLPGHCPGHVALRCDDIVFCGDMVVEGVTPHLSPESINPHCGLDHYLDSLIWLQHWAKEARLVLNGHNDVITDLPAQIQATKENILRRMSKGIESLGEPRTVDEICTAIYGEVQGYNRLLVIEKTGAYVEYLYEHGLLEIANPGELEQGRPVRYRNAGDVQAILFELGRKVRADNNIQIRQA